MAISFRCSGCQKAYSVAEAAAGKRVKCTQCGTVLTVPALTAPALVATAAPPVTAPPPAVAGHAAPPPAPGGPPEFHMPPPPASLPAAAVPPMGERSFGGPVPPPPPVAPPFAGVPAADGTFPDFAHMDEEETPSTAARNGAGRSSHRAPSAKDSKHKGDASHAEAKHAKNGKPGDKHVPDKNTKGQAADKKGAKQTGKHAKHGRRGQSSNKKWVIAGVALLLIGGGIGTFFALNGGKKDEPVADKKPPKSDGKDPGKATTDAKRAEPKADPVIPEIAGETVGDWKDNADPPKSSAGVPAQAELKRTIGSGTLAATIFPTTPSRFVAFAAEGGAVEVWDLGDPKKKWTLKDLPKSEAKHLGLSADGKLLLTAEESGGRAQPSVYTVQTGKVANQLLGMRVRELVDFGEEGQIVGVEGRHVQVFDMAKGAVAHEFDMQREPMAGAVALSPGRKFLAIIGSDPGLKNNGLVLEVYSVADKTLCGQYRLASSEKWTLAPTALGFSAAGTEVGAVLRAAGTGKTATPLQLRLICLNMTTGNAVADHKLFDERLTAKNKSGSHLRGIEWLARTGWLVDGRWLVDRLKGDLLWEVPTEEGVEAVHALRVLDTKRAVAVVTRKGKGDKLSVELAKLDLPSDATTAIALANAVKGPPKATDPPKTGDEKPPETTTDDPEKGTKPGDPEVKPDEPEKPKQKKIDPKVVDDTIQKLLAITDTLVYDQTREDRPLIEIDLKFKGEVDDNLVKTLANFVHLQKVNLENTSTGNGGISALKECLELRSLNVAETDVGDQGLFALKDLPKLEELNISRAGISDSGLMYISKMRNLVSLDISDLSRNAKVTDRGVLALKSLSKLKFLNIKAVEGISQETEAALKAAIPGLTITNF